MQISELVTIPIRAIEYINLSSLDQRKLNRLRNNGIPISETLSGYINPYTRETEGFITLDTSVTPHKIINGRHRIYLAREENITHLKAYLQRKR